MSTPKRTVLITGCSEGGLGFGLAKAFQAKGLRVFATARNPAKMTALEGLGIECLTLDVLSDDSIKACVADVSKLTDGTLDILINNAGGGYSMPFADIVVSKARQLFELNVWSYITVTQAFLPLLLRKKGMIVNNTSISSVTPTPHSSVYHASKAAAAMFSDHQRLELAPFGIRVVDLKTGGVHSAFHRNRSDDSTLPRGSIYEPARAETEKAIRGEHFSDKEDLDVWSRNVVNDLLKTSPPAQVWRGINSGRVWLWTMLGSHTSLDGTMSKMCGLDVLAKRLKEKDKS